MQNGKANVNGDARRFGGVRAMLCAIGQDEGAH